MAKNTQTESDFSTEPAELPVRTSNGGRPPKPNPLLDQVRVMATGYASGEEVAPRAKVLPNEDVVREWKRLLSRAAARVTAEGTPITVATHVAEVDGGRRLTFWVRSKIARVRKD